MRTREIQQFFRLLDEAYGGRAEVILTGAAAGAIHGHVRPSLDVDFEIRLLGRKTASQKAKWTAAIRAASRSTGLAVNFSENIGGWSMVSYLDYRKTAQPYRTFGRIRVRVLDPAYWTIGKMTRFLELDIRDMAQVIRRQKIPPARLVRLWARALRQSSLSLEAGQFREHVLYFLTRYSRRIWGAKTDPVKWCRTFERLIRGAGAKR